MSCISIVRKNIRAAALIAASLTALGGIALAEQDRNTVKVPDGLGFSDFKGYETWQVVAVSQSYKLGLIEVILGDPAMVAAYKSGLPAEGKQFPDGVRLAKIHWKATQSTTAPSTTTIPGDLDDVDFMMKDSKRFANTGGWGYAQFNYHPESETFTPLGTGAACGYACHNLVKRRDYVFTAFPKR